MSVYIDMILRTILAHTYTPIPYHTLNSFPSLRMDYLLEEDIKMELLLATAVQDDILTQEKQNEHMDDTTTISDSLNNKIEAAIFSKNFVNTSTKVTVFLNKAGRTLRLSLQELKLPLLKFEAATPNKHIQKILYSNMLASQHKLTFLL